MNRELDWILSVKKSTSRFLENQIKDKYVSYSYSDKYSKKLYYHIGSYTFALKILYIIDNKNYKEKLINKLLEYKKPTGEIYSNYHFIKSFLRNFLISIKTRNFINLDNHQYKMAETRQSYSVLKMLHIYTLDPKFFYLKILNKNNFLSNKLLYLNWNKPWNSGSHFSHFCFFLKYSYDAGKINKNIYEENKLVLIRFINSINCSKTGTWYVGETTKREKINGAMKIITGLDHIQSLSIINSKKIIDFILSIKNDESACDNFNIIYVLQKSFKSLNYKYRKNEVIDFALDRLKIYKKYYFSKEGGFSFYIKRSNDWYYNLKISKSRNEPDIHGTVMFLWGLTLISKILDLNKIIQFKEFKT